MSGGHLTDEEILGMEAIPQGDASGENRPGFAEGAHRERNGQGGLGARSGAASGAALDSELGGELDAELDSVWDAVFTDGSAASAPKNPQAEARATGGQAEAGSVGASDMPAWMAAAAADPAHGGEAAALWREHQEFRAAFASPEEARAVKDETRAIKELLPGGVRDIVSLREATQSVERIDAALFSGDARAQAEVVAELARANPAAFRALFAEAAKFLAGGGAEAGGREARGREESSFAEAQGKQITNHTSAGDAGLRAGDSRNFDAAAYAAFERGTNDRVASDVRGAIGDTLARVMPEGIAEGAARRMGEDIFNEVHRALAADRALSEQVAAILRDPSGASATGATRANAGAWRFGSAEQQRVAALLAGRAKQLVPSVARRVIGEWTSSVLNTARAKSARQAAAASRVDIAAAGGSLDAMPLRQMSQKEVNYSSMSDEQILGM